MQENPGRNTLSLSAWVVIACQLILRRHRRWHALPVQDDIAFYQACSDYCRSRSLLCRLIGRLPDTCQLWLLDHALARGAAQHFVLRKKLIAKQAREMIAAGVGQIVVIGGGFDPLAINLARQYPNVHCFEIDITGMHAHKKTIAGSFYGSMPANFYAIAADLSQTSLKTTLTAHPAFRTGVSTFFIAEGITMYLRSDNIERLFDDMQRLCGTPSSVMFTAIETHRESVRSWCKRLRNRLLSSTQETFSWSMPQKDMAHFLISRGFRQQSLIPYAELQRSWRQENEMPEIYKQNGEYIIYAVAQD